METFISAGLTREEIMAKMHLSQVGSRCLR